MRIPAVGIVNYTDKNIDEILYGIEEEGIPAVITDEETMKTYVKVSVYENEILVFFDKFSLEKPYISYTSGDSLRRIGANCARLIKGFPLH